MTKLKTPYTFDILKSILTSNVISETARRTRTASKRSRASRGRIKKYTLQW